MSSIQTYGMIAGVFERVCSHLVIDAKLAERVIRFQVSFVNKNEDHITFFGGNLTGVQVVRFTSTDMGNFFSDVLQVNEIELEDELHKLTAVDANRKVSGDVFNHSCLWLVHKLSTAEFPGELAYKSAMCAALILQYRYLSSLLNWYYKFPADPASAQAAYSRLTKKSAIKQFGSWHILLENRCQDFFPPKGLHRQTITEYKDDLAIIYALNDSQGRIRSLMKHLMAELKAARLIGARVHSTSSVIEIDGEGFLKDKTNNLSNYVNYIYRTLPDQHTFIKQEILSLITDTIYTAPPSLIQDTLVWMSKNYKTTKGKIIDEFVQDLLVHSFNYLGDNRSITRETNDLAGHLTRLKGVYMSSRSVDPALLKLRETAEEITTKAIKSKNASVISAVKTAVMLYIVIRAFTKGHYS